MMRVLGSSSRVQSRISSWYRAGRFQRQTEGGQTGGEGLYCSSQMRLVCIYRKLLLRSRNPYYEYRRLERTAEGKQIKRPFKVRSTLGHQALSYRQVWMQCPAIYSIVPFDTLLLYLGGALDRRCYPFKVGVPFEGQRG